MLFSLDVTNCGDYVSSLSIAQVPSGEIPLADITISAQMIAPKSEVSNLCGLKHCHLI